MIKELTLQEVARKLADEGVFDGLVKDYSSSWNKEKIIGVYFSDRDYPIVTKKENWLHCAIEIPDPKPVYEPYPDDVCPPLKCGDVVISKITNTKYLVTATSNEYKLGHVYVLDDFVTNECLFEEYTYQDGSPIGRIKEIKCQQN